MSRKDCLLSLLPSDLGLFQLGLLNLVILYSGIWQYTFGKVALAGAAPWLTYADTLS